MFTTAVDPVWPWDTVEEPVEPVPISPLMFTPTPTFEPTVEAEVEPTGNGDSGSLNDLLGWEALTDREHLRGTRRGNLLRLIAGAVVMGGFIAAAALPVAAGTAMSAHAVASYIQNLPSQLPAQPMPQRSFILAADGTRIATFYSENRVPVTFNQIAPVMRNAIVAIEDSRFWQRDSAVDVRGTLRASVEDLLGHGGTQGGSTIEQQYVKNVLLNDATTAQAREEATSQTSLLRKLKEARYATHLLQTTSKQDILTSYLNVSYFGDGAYGVGAASEHYFNVAAADLTLPQAALLAGLVQDPTGYDPVLQPAAAVARRDTVLFRMHQLGELTDSAYKAAVATPLKLHLHDVANGCTASRYPFYCDYVKQQLENDPVFGATPELRQERLYRGGMTIRTPLVRSYQDAAQAAAFAAMGKANPVVANAVTVQPGTGYVLDMVSSRPYGLKANQTEVILPTIPAYQPGSNFKPFTLTTALEQGYNLNTVWDAPAQYAPAGFSYPGNGFINDGPADDGPLNAAQALWRSSNTWYVHLETQVGVLNVAHMAQRLGITSLPMSGPNAITARDASLTLGAYEVSPMQMAGAYATFAAGGVHCDPIVITGITVGGKNIPVPSANCHQAISAGVADTVASIMQGTIDGPDPSRTGAGEDIGRPAAGKTGTTENEAAVWFTGYTPQLATSVEVDDPDGAFAHPLRGFYAYGAYIPVATGGTVAGPLWKQIMLADSTRLPAKAFPPADANTMTGGSVTLTPDVRGLSPAQAYQVLSALGISVRIDPSKAPVDSRYLPGEVVTSSPTPGQPLGYNDTVTLTLSAGSTTTTQQLPHHGVVGASH